MSNAESVQNIHEFLIRTIDRLIKTKSEYLVYKLGRDFAEIPKIRQVNQVMIISQYMGNYYNTNSIWLKSNSKNNKSQIKFANWITEQDKHMYKTVSCIKTKIIKYLTCNIIISHHSQPELIIETGKINYLKTNISNISQLKHTRTS